MSPTSELFLIEALCEETGDWIEMEISQNPWPTDPIIQSDALYRWRVIHSDRPLKRAHAG